MKQEFEIVSHPRFSCLSVFLVHLLTRTPHIHRDLELGVVLEGRLSIRLGERTWELGRDELYLINSMEPHEFSGEESGALVLAVQISPKLLDPFLPSASMLRFRTEPPLGGLEPSVQKQLRRHCAELGAAYYGRPEHYELGCYRLTLDLLCELAQVLPSYYMDPQEYVTIRNRAKRMMEVTDYIDQNFRRKLLLEELAELQGLTMPHLSHLFRETLGVSFQEYLKQKRFEYACTQLAGTDRSVLDISLDSGFSDLRYMTRLFRERFDCTPREYRGRLHGGAAGTRVSDTSLQYFPDEREALEKLKEAMTRYGAVRSTAECEET